MAAENEWGIPDWGDAKAYGDWRSWSDARWRWEFCRRKDDLRKAFDREAKRLSVAPTVEDEFRAFIRSLPFVNPSNEVRLKFGYSVLPNPRFSMEPDRNWLNNLEPDFLRIWAAKPLRETFVEQNLSFTGEAGISLGHLFHATPVSLEEGQFAVVFDIGQPLTPQIESAREKLTKLYLERGAEPSPRDRLTKNTETVPKDTAALRLKYLRTLDAKAAGARYIDIARLHTKGDPTKEMGRTKYKQALEVWRKIRINSHRQ